MLVVAFMDASSLTGPARNLLRFCRLAGARSGGGCRISIVTVVRAGPGREAPANAFVEAARAAAVEVTVIREEKRFDRRVIGELRRVFAERSPEVVQSHSVKSHVLTMLARPGGARWLAYHHGYTAEDLKMRLYNQLDRWSLPRADRVVTVCRPFAEMLARRGVARERIRVLPNAIEPGFEAPGKSAELRRQWEIPAEAPVVAAVGRLSREKGHGDLIEAARLLRERDPALRFHLLLVGEGPERAPLAAQIEAAGLAGRVRLVGHVPDPRGYYELADAFVLPSHSEGSPNVLLEAMAAGVPVVACAVGGVPESVQDGESGLLVKAHDPGGLAAALGRVLQDRELAERLRRGGREAVRAKHSPESYCDNLLGIYGELQLPEKTVTPL